MAVLVYKSETITKLESELKQFDKILLIDNSAFSVNCLLKEIEKQNDNKMILVLSAYEMNLYSSSMVMYKQITEEQQAHILEIYNMYEFSDRFIYVTRDSRCGNIWNYVDSGILTMEEAIAGLLC